MAGLTLTSEGSGSLAKLQLLHELLQLRSGWTQGCRISDKKSKVLKINVIKKVKHNST